jgi:hypothetical protein
MPVTKMSCNDWLGSWTTGYLAQAESEEKLTTHLHSTKVCNDTLALRLLPFHPCEAWTLVQEYP